MKREPKKQPRMGQWERIALQAFEDTLVEPLILIDLERDALADAPLPKPGTRDRRLELIRRAIGLLIEREIIQVESQTGHLILGAGWWHITGKHTKITEPFPF